MEEDRLSELPNSLIFLILSFLPMSDVVRTTILSKHWNDLWTTIPYLNFSEDCERQYDGAKIRNFVNRALLFWKGDQILKFRLDVYVGEDTSFAGDIDLWVRFAVQNKVQELKLIISGELVGDYKIPRCLNSCSSITKLSLIGCGIQKVQSVAWNQLKSLKIVGAFFDERSIDQILLGTPQLEVFELRVLESNENLNIRSMSLKKLKINMYVFYGEESPDIVLDICCPNVETLEISGMIYKCLVSDVSYLTDATLGFNDPYDDDRDNELFGRTLKDILPAFQHVEKLTLSAWCLEVLGALQKEYLLSALPTVKILKLYVHGIVETDDVMNLLGIFPNLKMFVVIEDEDMFDPIIQNTDEIDEGSSEDNAETMSFGRNVSKGEVNDFLNMETINSKPFLLQLNKIEITSKLSDTSIFRLTEELLKHATMLENLVVRVKECVRPFGQAFLFEVEQKLLSIPRSSPTAKLFFMTN